MKKYIRFYLKWPVYSPFFIIFTFIAILLTWYSVGFGIYLKHFLFVVSSIVIVIIFTSAEFFLKRYDFGRTIIGLMVIWVFIAGVFVFSDVLYNGDKNLEEGYVSFASENETEESLEFDIAGREDDQVNLLLNNDTGKIYLKDRSDKTKVDVSARYSYDDESPVMINSSTENTFNNTLDLTRTKFNIGRFFVDQQPEYNILVPQVINTTLDLRSSVGDTTVELGKIDAKAAIFSLTRGRQEISILEGASFDALTFKINSSTFNLNLVSQSSDRYSLSFNKSDGELRMQDTSDGEYNISLVDSKIIVYLDKQMGYKLNLKGIGQLDIENEQEIKLNGDTEEYVSTGYNQADRTINLDISLEYSSISIISSE